MVSLWCEAVWFGVLWSLVSSSLTHSFSCLCHPPRLLFHPLIFPSGPSTDLQNKPTPPTSKRLRYFLLFNPCVRLLLVRCQHLRALSISITGGKTGLIWSLDLKETSSPLLCLILLRISCSSLFVLDYVLCAILRSLLVHLCLLANSIPLCCSITNRLLDSEAHFFIAHRRSC